MNKRVMTRIIDREKYFEAIYKKYFNKLYAYSKVICNSRDQAKDVVSDLFYSLWKNQVDLGRIHDLEMYLFVSVRNLSVKALLKNKKEPLKEDFELIQGSVDYIDPEELLLEKELRIVLDEIVAQLPTHCQLIYRMAKEQGLKYAEIGEELGISAETVKTQIKKAHSLIRRAIVTFYKDKNSQSFSNAKVVGQMFLFLSICNYDFLN